eukprot:COSAG01_NODE_3397_length_6144_cov_33.015550_4_plen_142_part_00
MKTDPSGAAARRSACHSRAEGAWPARASISRWLRATRVRGALNIYFVTRTDITSGNVSQNGRQKGHNGRRTGRQVGGVDVVARQRHGVLEVHHLVRGAGYPRPIRGVSIFLDQNRRCIGKSQSERFEPPQRTRRRAAHRAR